MKNGFRFHGLEINTPFIMIILIGLPNCHKKKKLRLHVFLSWVSLGKSNKDILTFNNYSFVSLIARRFSRKKYNKIFFDFFSFFFMFLVDFYEGYF